MDFNTRETEGMAYRSRSELMGDLRKFPAIFNVFSLKS